MSRESRELAKRKAKETRKKYFDDSNNPMEAFKKIFQHENITLEYVGDVKERIKKNNDSYVLQLPYTSSPARDNFSIAHELGHVFLHNMKDQQVFNRSGLPIEEEIEANLYAAELLMPEEEFRIKAIDFSNSEFLLAEYFGVSPTAALTRMASLKIK